MVYNKKLPIFQYPHFESLQDINKFYELRQNNGCQTKEIEGLGFRENQFYVSLGEMMPLMLAPSMAFLSSGYNKDEYYFTSFYNRLVAFKLDGSSEGVLFYNEENKKWQAL